MVERKLSRKTFGLYASVFSDDRCRLAAGPVSEILAQQQDNKYFQQILLQVRQDVEEGSTLAAAMARHPRVLISFTQTWWKRVKRAVFSI